MFDTIIRHEKLCPCFIRCHSGGGTGCLADCDGFRCGFRRPVERGRIGCFQRVHRNVHDPRRGRARAARGRRGGRDGRQARRGVHGDDGRGERRLRTRRAGHLYRARRHGRRALGLPRRRLPAPAQQGRMGAGLHLHPLRRLARADRLVRRQHARVVPPPPDGRDGPARRQVARRVTRDACPCRFRDDQQRGGRGTRAPHPRPHAQQRERHPRDGSRRGQAPHARRGRPPVRRLRQDGRAGRRYAHALRRRRGGRARGARHEPALLRRYVLHRRGTRTSTTSRSSAAGPWARSASSATSTTPPRS